MLKTTFIYFEVRTIVIVFIDIKAANKFKKPEAGLLMKLLQIMLKICNKIVTLNIFN